MFCLADDKFQPLLTEMPTLRPMPIQQHILQPTSQQATRILDLVRQPRGRQRRKFQEDPGCPITVGLLARAGTPMSLTSVRAAQDDPNETTFEED